MQIKKDEELAQEFADSSEESYVIFLQRSLEIQYDILAQEPREQDLTCKYIAVLETELDKFTTPCEVCGDNSTQTRYDEHNGWQSFCEAD